MNAALDTNPGALSGPGDDLSALAWVQGELRKSLDAANKSLRRYLKDTEALGGSDVDAVDPAVLRNARAQIHQGVGALELVGLPGPAKLLRACEAAVQRLASRPTLMNLAAVDAVEQASFALLDYLGRLLAGKQLSPVALFPQYRAVQELAGADRVHPADLWPQDFAWQELPAEAAVVPRPADDQTRSAMEALVLALMRQPDRHLLKHMSDLCAGLAAGVDTTAGPSRLAVLWQLAAAFFEAQSQGLLPNDVYGKRVASRLLAQLRSTVKGQEDLSERLAQDLLFFCANARHPARGRTAGPRLLAVRQAWGLPAMAEATVDYDTPRLGRFDPAWIAQARKRVASAKDAWSAVAGGELHRLGGLSELFTLVGDSLQRLFPSGDVLATVLQQAVQQTAQIGQAPDAPLAMEVATSMLYVDACIEDGELDHPELSARMQRLASRIEDVRRGADPHPLEAWMEELYRRVSDRQTMGSVVAELRASLSEVEKQIDQYFRDPSQRQLLIPVPAQLSAMRGVLSVLGMGQASQAVLHMRDEVDALVQTEVDPHRAVQAGTFDHLADNLGALSFLIDMLSVQPTLAKSLFSFDPSTGKLSAVMGQAERPSAFAAFDDAPASASVPLLDQAQQLAEAAAQADLPPQALAEEFERLSRQAAAADQPGLARVAHSARQALDQAGDDSHRQAAAHAELAQALADYAPPAPPALPPAAPVPPVRDAAPGETGLEDDDEMREIFIEEAQEVVANAQASLAKLAEQPDDLGEMTTVRRAFHTLKGSARMVGLKDFGEAAWACEQLYNARLAEAPHVDADLRGFSLEALDYLAGWTDAIAQRTPAGHTPTPVVQAADALRLEGRRVPVQATPAAHDTPVAGPAPAAPWLPPADDLQALSQSLSGFLAPGERAPAAEASDAVPVAEATETALDLPLDGPAPEGWPADLDLGEVVEATELPAMPDLVLDGDLPPADAALTAEALALDAAAGPFETTQPLPPAGAAADEVAAADAARLPVVDFSFDLALPEGDAAHERTEPLPPPVADAVEPPQADAATDLSLDLDLAVGDEPDLSLDLDLATAPEGAQNAAPAAEAEAADPTASPAPTDAEEAAAEAPQAEAPAEPADPVPVQDAPAAPAAPALTLDEAAIDAALAALAAEDAVEALDEPGDAEAAAAAEAAELAALAEAMAADGVGPAALAAETGAPEAPLAEAATDAPAEPVEATDLEREGSAPAESAPVDETDAVVPEALVDAAVDADTASVDSGAPAADAWQGEAPEEVVDLQDLAQLDGLALADMVATPEAVEAAAVVEVAEVDEGGAGLAANDAQILPTDDDEQVKLIGGLRISIPLFNIYLNEADELSRRLGTELAEWAHEHERHPVSEAAVALAHSLAGSSATVGYADLSALARALEHALMRSQSQGRGRAGEPALFAEAAEEIRRLLHQFAAGFLRTVEPGLMERLADHERWPAAPAQPELGEDGEADDSASGFDAAPAVQGSAFAPLMPQGADVRLDDDELDAADAIDDELFPIFEEEADELLPQLQARLREWLDHPGSQDAPAACMRTLHTFKGGARLAGAMRLGEMAHRLEAGIEALMAPLSHGGVHAHAAEIEPLLARADAMVSAYEILRAGPAADGVDLALDAGASQALPAAAVAVAAELAEAGEPPVPADAADAAASGADQAGAASLSAPAWPSAATRGEVLPVAGIDWARFAVTDPTAAVPAQASERPLAAGSAMVRVRGALLDRLVNQAGEVSITRARIDGDVKGLQVSLNELTDSLDRMRRQLRDIELQAETQMASRIEAAKAAAAAFDPLEMDRFTRFQELTRFMAESVNDVATLQRSLQRTLQSTEDQLAAQARLTRELQDDLLRTRMVEFDSMADRLYRTVRQAAKDTGKQVRLDISGGAIEIDRGVLERMAGPFEHLLRNSVAHGVESPDAREAAGKDRTGTISVRITQEGNEVGVTVHDDGAGLNLARIRERGLERGLIGADEQPADDELAQLIFAPGFSTAATVTELAGRGVGLDVVRAEVNAMGGRVQVNHRAGEGASFRLLLPLTTAVTQVVMLRCGDLQVAVPSTLVEAVRRERSAEVEAAYAQGQLTVAGEALPFFWLAALLQGPLRGGTEGRSQAVVLIRSADQRVALHVDEVLGNQEVVVKNVGPQLARLPGLAGVTLLPSGAVALIYNPVALATLYGPVLAPRVAALATQPASAVAEALPTVHKAPLVLVVDDSLTVRRVTQRLLVREGYRVTTAKDGMDALERLVEERPSVMLSDIEMPRMDGFDLARNVRADERFAQLPIIMITSRIAQKHREYAASLGVDHYLGKPYSEEELLALIARYVEAEARI